MMRRPTEPIRPSFYIEVDELARILAFIVPDRFGRLQNIELIQPQPTQNTTDGGW